MYIWLQTMDSIQRRTVDEEENTDGSISQWTDTPERLSNTTHPCAAGLSLKGGGNMKCFQMRFNQCHHGNTTMGNVEEVVSDVQRERVGYWKTAEPKQAESNEPGGMMLFPLHTLRTPIWDIIENIMRQQWATVATHPMKLPSYLRGKNMEAIDKSNDDAAKSHT